MDGGIAEAGDARTPQHLSRRRSGSAEVIREGGLVSVTVKELDTMPPDQARGLLAECCGSSKWVNEMVARRPFRSREKVFKAAEEIADTLEANDWLEAFAHHPRIGEKPPAKTGISAGV